MRFFVTLMMFLCLIISRDKSNVNFFELKRLFFLGLFAFDSGIIFGPSNSDEIKMFENCTVVHFKNNNLKAVQLSFVVFKNYGFE